MENLPVSGKMSIPGIPFQVRAVPVSHCAVAVSPHFLRFDLTGDCPGVRLGIQARTAHSHMERSATPSCGRAAFGLAKNSSP